MKTRLDSVPVMHSVHQQIDAHTFNTIRLGMLRLPAPIRLAIPGMRDLRILLDKDLWLCVDESNNDLPILAFSDFEVANRTELAAPVKCLVRYYHYHADLIRQAALETAVSYINQQLHPTDQPQQSVD